MGNYTGEAGASAIPPEPRKATDRTWREVGADTTRSIAQGLIDFGGVLPGTIAGAITGNYQNPWLKTAKGINDVIDEQMSPGMLAQKKELNNKLQTAEGWREKFAVGGIETLKNPALLLDTAARSAPSMVGGGLFGRVAGEGAIGLSNAALARTISTGSEAAAKVAVGARAVAPAAATTGATGAASLSQGASVASDTYDALMKLPSSNFAAEPEYAGLAERYGPQKAQQMLAAAAANRAFAVGTAVSVGSMMLPGGSTIEKAFIPAALRGEAKAASQQVTQNFLTRPLTKGMEGGLVSKAIELNVKGTKAGLEEAISEPIEEGGGAFAQGLEQSRAGADVKLGEMTGEAAGQAAAAGFAMGRASSMGHNIQQTTAGTAREARIKQMQDAGETATADLLKRQHDKATAVEAVDSELQRMPGTPAYADTYRALRTAGVKPAESAARANMVAMFQGAAESAGIPEKALSMATEKAKELPLDQVPSFFQKFTNGLAARGVIQTFNGMDQMASSVEQARDDAIERATSAMYAPDDIRKSMDSITALENAQNTPTAQVDTASQAINNIAPQADGLGVNTGESNVSRSFAIPAVDSVADGRRGDQPAVGVDAGLGERALVDRAVDTRRAADAATGDAIPPTTSRGGALNEQNSPPAAITQERTAPQPSPQAAPVEVAAPERVVGTRAPAARTDAGSAPLEAARVMPAAVVNESLTTQTPAQLGRNNTPLGEGGKAFKTKLAADTARKQQPMMRVVRVDGGYALAEKTPAQLDAQEKAARRLSTPQTSPNGEAIPAHAMIASSGGLAPAERSDMNMQGNVAVGNRKLFAAPGKGLSIERATERLVEDGYLPEDASHDDARALIKRSLTSPQYTPEGTEHMAEKEAAQRESDYNAEQEAIARMQEADDNAFADLVDAYELAALELPAAQAQSDMTMRDALSAAGLTEQEISDALTDRSTAAQADRQDAGVTSEAATGESPQADRGRESAPGSIQGQDAGLTDAAQQPAAAPTSRPADLVELRKRKSVLESIRKCMGG